tara:strand:+ start:222 stop:509 length:288 start_codon:yes stop_codon:yes gene_type:complete
MIEIVKIYTSKAVWYFEIKINKQSIKEKDFADHTVFYTKKDAKKCFEDNKQLFTKLSKSFEYQNRDTFKFQYDIPTELQMIIRKSKGWYLTEERS